MSWDKVATKLGIEIELPKLNENPEKTIEFRTISTGEGAQIPGKGEQKVMRERIPGMPSSRILAAFDLSIFT